MKPIIKYCLVWKRNLQDFEMEVNNKIMLGWEPQGGAAVESEPDEFYSGKQVYVQAMVLREDAEVT